MAQGTDTAEQHEDEQERMSTSQKHTTAPEPVGGAEPAPQILTLLGDGAAGPTCTDGSCSI